MKHNGFVKAGIIIDIISVERIKMPAYSNLLTGINISITNFF